MSISSGSRGGTVIVFLVVVFVAVFLMLFVFTALTGLRLFWRTQAKGYRGPVAPILFYAGILVPILGMAFAGAVAGRLQLQDSGTVSLMLAAFVVLNCLLLAIAALT